MLLLCVDWAVTTNADLGNGEDDAKHFHWCKKKKKWVFALKGNFLWLEVVGFSVFVSYESEDEEHLELSYIADANVKGCSRFGKQLGSFSQC